MQCLRFLLEAGRASNADVWRGCRCGSAQLGNGSAWLATKGSVKGIGKTRSNELWQDNTLLGMGLIVCEEGFTGPLYLLSEAGKALLAGTAAA